VVGALLMQLGSNGGPPLADDAPPLTYFKFYPSDWLAGTADMTAEERGIYITALAVMYDRMGGMPYDERKGAPLMRVDIRIYRRVRDKLIAEGKFVRDGDMIRNMRVEKEITDYVRDYRRRSEAAKKREAERRLHRTSGELPANLSETSARSSEEVSKKLVELEAKKPTISKDDGPQDDHILEARSQKPEARTKEDKKVLARAGQANGQSFWSQAMTVPGAYNPNDGVSINQTTGEIELFNGVRQQWLSEFGGDGELLRLALKQAANYVQPNAYKPLRVQVEAQLAQIVRQERSMQKRYEAAKQSKPQAETPEQRKKRLFAQAQDEMRGRK
jgi:uncharacterized protein YdaU (DUF1376 family)